MHWVEMLPDTQTPSWLGLPSNAEKVLLTTQGMPQSIITIIGTGPKLISIFFSSVNRQGFHAYLGSIINHLSLYSSVFVMILTWFLSAARHQDVVFLCLYWAEQCPCMCDGEEYLLLLLIKYFHQSVSSGIICPVAPESCILWPYSLAMYW